MSEHARDEFEKRIFGHEITKAADVQHNIFYSRIVSDIVVNVISNIDSEIQQATNWPLVVDIQYDYVVDGKFYPNFRHLVYSYVIKRFDKEGFTAKLILDDTAETAQIHLSIASELDLNDFREFKKLAMQSILQEQ